jgi:glycosyltransferase involved in cell wall biosynthesis
MDQIFCSVVIPTIGRASLNRSVCSVLEQDFQAGQFEVIVVNDSGKDLPGAAWQQDRRVSILHTQKRERDFARSSGAAISQGRYFIFLDDDDFLLPGALHSLWDLVQQKPDAVWYYGGLRIIDEQEDVLAEINSGLSGNCCAQIMGGAWAPIQASMLRAETFFQVGGFNPSIIGTEDLDLCRRFAVAGDFANTSAIIAFLQRGRSWNTSTDYLRAAEDTRFSRDQILGEPGILPKMLHASRSCYWRGRILRVYLSAAGYNARRSRFFTALSRLLFAGASLFSSLSCAASRDYWQGVKADHVPGTLHFVMKEYEQRLQGGKGR